MQGKPNIWKIDASREDFNPTHREAKVINQNSLKERLCLPAWTFQEN